MTVMQLSYIAKQLNAIHQGDDVAIDTVSSDSRHLQAGDLFVALSGPNFDAHDFVKQAQEKGAIAALVERPLDTALPLLIVDDAEKALGQLAALRRQQSKAQVIALTGSCGKTSTKSMLANIFSYQGPTLATQGTLNNHIGVPLTLLGLQDHHEYAIIEMGANHFHEIDYLTNLAKPDVALLLNAADVHLEGFGDREGVARAKGEIFNGLSADGKAILNADDAYFSYWQGLVADKTYLSFGMDNAADAQAKAVQLDAEGRSSFTLTTAVGSVDITLQLLGLHHVKNAVAAAAVSLACGLSLEHIQRGLQETVATDKRLEVKQGVNGIAVIDDSYNGTPAGFNAAIQVLSSLDGEKVLVAGTMGELGEHAVQLHQQLGEQARIHGIARLYTCGEWMNHAVDSFGEGGQYFSDKTQLLSALTADLNANMTILVKGSKFMQMWDIVNALIPKE